jgi:hypothetical protein
VKFECWRYQSFSWVLCLALVVSGCASGEVAFDKRPSGDGFRQITIGLCEDYPEESSSLDAARRDLLFLKTNNIHALRIAFGWDSIEPERGRYDWTFWDEFIQGANHLGIRLIPYVCYTPKWASSDEGTNFWRAPPKSPEDLKQFLSTIVNRYKSSIHSWEIWNEPDNPAYWSGSVGEFAALLKAGSQGVRESDPKAKVVSGGIAWNLDFLRQLFEEHGVSPFVDVVNVHNYNETWAAEPLEKVYDVVNRTKDLVTLHGNNQAVWLAEVGYSDYRKGRYVSDIYTARFAFEHTPEYQAVSIGRAITQAAASGDVSLVAWYRIHDLPQQQEVIGDVNNRHLGVLTTNEIPKPALEALRFFSFLFSGPVRSVDREVRVSRAIESDVETHVFQSERHGVFAIAWLRPNSRSVQKEDSSEPFTISLPCKTSRPVMFFDEQGKPKGQLNPRVHGAITTIENVALHSGELRVILLQSKRNYSRAR